MTNGKSLLLGFTTNPQYLGQFGYILAITPLSPLLDPVCRDKCNVTNVWKKDTSWNFAGKVA